jgi:hypothetical protein
MPTCDQCNFENEIDTIFCPQCGAAIGLIDAPKTGAMSDPVLPITSRLSIASLTLGILGIFLSFLVIPWVLAIIFGHRARGKIRRSNGALKGSGLALAGLVLGYATLPLVWAFGVIAVDANERYIIRAKTSAGLAVAEPLKMKITEAFGLRPRDMSCNHEICPLGLMELDPTDLANYTKRVASDKTGLIVIEYKEDLLKSSHNRLTLTPLIDGARADLSDASNAGKTITWQCGKDALTTVPTKYLPFNCK